MKIRISVVPEELADMAMQDMMKVVAMFLSGRMISYLPTEKKVKDFLPIEFTLHEGNLLDILVLLDQLGFTAQGSENGKFSSLRPFTVQ